LQQLIVQVVLNTIACLKIDDYLVLAGQLIQLVGELQLMLSRTKTKTTAVTDLIQQHTN
jgi:hypothetical protein